MRLYDEEYYCPNCDAILNDQSGFDPDNGAWTCTECGQEIFGDDIEATQKEFDDVVWYCDSCNAVLSKQSGFSDDCRTWQCTECGHINDISEDEIYESRQDYESQQYEGCRESSDDDDYDDDDDDYDDDDDEYDEEYEDGDDDGYVDDGDKGEHGVPTVVLIVIVVIICLLRWLR